MNSPNFHNAHVPKEKSNFNSSIEMNDKEMVHCAQQHYQENQTTEATELCLNILKQIPHHEEALHLLGTIAFDNNNFKESVEYLEQAVQANSESWKSHYALGCALSALNFQAESILHFRKALLFNPDAECVHYELGLALEKCEETEAAFLCYENCIKINPQHSQALKQIGILLFLNDQCNEADAYLHAAININADDPVLRYYYAETLKTIGDFTQAIDWLQSILQTHPHSYEASFSLAEIYHSHKSFSEAIRHYEHSLSIYSQNTVAWVNLGSLYESQGESEKSFECYQNAITLDSNNAAAYYNLGYHHQKRKEYLEAKDCFEKVVAIEPNHFEGFNHLGIIHHFQGHIEKSIECYQKSIDIGRDKSKAYSNLELIYFNQKSYQDLIPLCEQAISYYPEQAIHHYYLGVSLLETGETEKSISFLETAVQLEPSISKYHYVLGNAFKNQNEFEKAISSYEKALKIEPEMFLAKYNSGNVYRNAKEFEKALASFDDVLEQDPDHIPSLITKSNIYRTIDRVDEAIETLEAVMNRIGEEPALKLWSISLCPKVVDSVDELTHHHKKGIADLKRLSVVPRQLSPEELISTGSPPSYYLQFHGMDSLPLKKAYGQYYDHIIKRPTQPNLAKKPSIGIFLTDGHEGVFVRYLGRVLEQFQNNDFETIVLCSKKCRRNIQKRISVEHLTFQTLSNQFSEMITQISNLELDVIYHWEVGSDLLNYFLPFYQLAPQQVTSVGLPETTGIPQMTHFLSSSIHEDEISAKHYSEELILSDSLLTVQSRMEITEKKSKLDLGIPENKNIYFCGQKVHKFHPDFDPFLKGILENDPNGIIIIPSDDLNIYAEKLKRRFNNSMPQVYNRIHFVPRLTTNEYFNLISLSDVILDTIYYGGGLSVLDFLSFNKPVITLPGEFLRGKVTAGTFRHMGIEEFIVNSEEDYILKSVQLGTNQEYRNHWEQKIHDHSSVIFENDDAVQDYQDIFSRLIQINRS